MDSVVADWFWFWLLVVVLATVVARALAASSMGILCALTSLAHHNSLCVFEEKADFANDCMSRFSE